MAHRVLANMMMDSIILGANRFNLISQYHVDKLLSTALEIGIRHLDTAPTYLTSENKIGNFLKRNPCAFNVSTKIFRNQAEVSTGNAQNSVRESLARLGVEQISSLYIHGTAIFTEDLGVVELLQRYRESGIVKKIGWCGNLSKLIENEKDIYQSLMIRVNPWDRSIESRQDLLFSKELIGMNIFANGFWNYRPWGRLKTYYSGHLRRRFNPYPSYYLNHPNSEALQTFQNFESLIKFALSRTYLDRIVIGTLNPEHLTQISSWISGIENVNKDSSD